MLELWYQIDVKTLKRKYKKKFTKKYKTSFVWLKDVLI